MTDTNPTPTTMEEALREKIADLCGTLRALLDTLIQGTTGRYDLCVSAVSKADAILALTSNTASMEEALREKLPDLIERLRRMSQGTIECPIPTTGWVRSMMELGEEAVVAILALTSNTGGVKKEEGGSDANAHDHLSMREGASPTETGWLIEFRDQDGKPTWLTLKPAHAALWGLVWTAESAEALRFARRVDAEDYYAAHIDTSPYIFITEHRWG